MDDLKEDISRNIQNNRMALNSWRSTESEEKMVLKEPEAVQHSEEVITGNGSDIVVALSCCEGIKFKEIDLKDSTKNSSARQFETEAEGSILLLVEDFRYEDDQCSGVTSEEYPASPSIDREIVELLSCESNNDLTLGCHTPKESIFDPFSSGPEELAFAPMKKIPFEIKFPPWRKINYDLFDDSFEIANGNICDDSVEDCLIDFISKSLLELIVASEARKLHDDINPVEHRLLEYLKTPSLPLLTGIAETCPSAPMRPAGRSMLLSKGICRKLDFGDGV